MAATNGMNRPGTVINWIDQSQTDNVVEDTIIKPLFLQLFTADKGPEKLTTVSGQDFFKMYGSNPSFIRHGQPLIQAAEIIKAGGELLCQRVVAEDATLANLIVVAKVSNELVQKVDAQGRPLFIDKDTGKETTESAGGKNERAMINTAKVKYDAVSIKGAKTLQEVKTYGAKLLKDELEYDETTSYDHVTKVGDPLTDENPVGQVRDTDDPDYDKYIYPLFAIVDNGRGVSSKRFKIVPDYNVSKSLSFQLYKLMYIGDSTNDNEYVWFNFQDDVIYLEKNRSLNMIGKDMMQIKGGSFDDAIDLYIKRLSNITGIDEAELNSIDALFGRNRRGENIQQMSIDEEGYNLSDDLGMMLQEGSNGVFGNYPINSSEYGPTMVKVLDGTYDDSIFDRDRFMIDVAMDANYPMEVKDQMYALAEFRQDFVFFRDFGTDLTTFESIQAVKSDLKKSRFVADYCQAWGVIDPWSKKQIMVTAPYSLATRLVKHLIDKRSAPVCGILHEFTFPEVIEGTVTFLPKVTPSVDQKVLLKDMQVNYASYLNGAMTMETEYTTQEYMTQLSYINNILAVTKVIHNIRTECPKLRYSFITDTDLVKYKDEVNKVINRTATDFASIYMEYTQDDVMEANKIFEADIFVKFKNFEQEEIFNIYTLA